MAATKFSADFESSTAKLVTLSGVSEGQMKKMRQAVLDLAPTVGIGPRALSEALLVVTSTGFEGAQAMEILSLAAKGSAIGMGETKDIARALTAAISAYGTENLTAAQAADILHATVVAGGAEATELAGELGRVVGVASSLGVSFAEVGAFIATYTRLGLSAAEATTGLSGVLNMILNPSKEARDALAGLGLSADVLRQQVAEQGLGAALTSLIGRLHGNSDATGALFGNVRALAGVMGTAGTQAEAYRSNLDKIQHSSGNLNVAFEQTKKTMAFMWDAFKAKTEQVAIVLGDQLRPAIERILTAAIPVVEAIGKMVIWFGQLPTGVQTAAFGFVSLAAAIGPIAFLVGNVMQAGSALLKLWKLLQLGDVFVAMLTPIASAQRGIASLYLVAAAHPFVAITAAVAGLIFALGKLKGAFANAFSAYQQGGFKAVLGELGRNVNNDDLSFFKSFRVDQQPGANTDAALDSLRALGLDKPMSSHGSVSGSGAITLPQIIGTSGGGGGGTAASALVNAEVDRLAALIAEADRRVLASRPDPMRGIGGGINPDWMGVAPIPNLGFTSGIQGNTLPGAQLGIPQAPPPPSFLSNAFGSSGQAGFGIASAIMGAIQSGGSTWQAGGAFIGQGIATQLGKTLTSGAGIAIGGALGGAINAIMPGLGALLGPLLGKLGSLFKNLFGGNKVKDLINDSFGSYGELRELLNPLGAQGDQMWMQLTQQTGKGDVASARQQIDAINAALDAHNQKLTETAVAAEQAGAAESTAFTKAKDALAQLDQQIQGLQQSIANEAPEEVMGVVEQQIRAQIAALEEQRRVAQTIIDELNAQQIVIPVRLDASGIDLGAIQRGELPEGWTPSMGGGEGFEQPEVPAMATGGVVRASRGGTIVRLAEGGSDEAVVPLKSGGFSGGGAGSTIVIEMDGRSVAEFIVPHIPGVVRRYGLV